MRRGAIPSVRVAVLTVLWLAAAGRAGGSADDAAQQRTLRDPVKTDTGYVAGTWIGEPEKPVRIYRGIPYAAPPVGPLRWKPPQPVTPWSGIREATLWSKMAPQSFPSSPVYENVPESRMSEDCLYLNVVTPATRPDAKLPVMVWFHGGGLTSGWGNSQSNNSAPLPQQGVVLVSVNHRIGALGYLAHPALTAESEKHVSGNYGGLDTLAALQWVKRNIAAFGGDPGRVTIFGVSGGGQKVLWLMASPLAKGLFHRAIVMSGGIGATPLAQTEKSGEKLAQALGVGEGAEGLAALREKPWQEIVKASTETKGYRPQFTDDGWSLQGVAAQSDVPLLVGFMGAEKEPTRSPAFIARAITPATQGLTTRYAYTFTHLPYGWGSKGGLAYHGGDVAYAFGVPQEIPDHFGNLYRPDPKLALPADPGIDERDAKVAQIMLKTFARFAATGDPNLDAETQKQLGASWQWPRLDASDRYLDIGVTPIVKTGWVKAGENQQAPRY
jgi:para-nitrobenzyl esterase